MADSPSVDFGRSLRAARESRGLSLSQLAQKTKISASVLDALERNDVSRLPGGIFARAFVRSYAVEVGLHPDKTVDAFIEHFSRKGVGAGRPHASEREENQAIENNRRAAQSALVLVGLSLPFAIAIVYLSATGWRRGWATKPSGSASIREVAEVTPARTPDSAPLRLALTVLRACWVSVTVDGQRVVARTMTAGETAGVTGVREVVLRVGDAAALTLTINDQPATTLGTAGAAVTLRITPENYRSVLAGR